MHIHQWLCKLISDSNDKYEDNQLVSGWRGLEGTRSVGQCWAGVDTGAALRRVRCHTQRARSIRPYLSHHQPADPATSHVTRDTAWRHVTRDTCSWHGQPLLRDLQQEAAPELPPPPPEGRQTLRPRPQGRHVADVWPCLEYNSLHLQFGWRF